jgi:AP-2 complex subunit alpha
MSLPDANEQEGGSADLLGLGVPSLDNGHDQINGNAFGPPVNNISKFYCKNNGVLYENDIIQIGVKTECKSNLARLAVFYGNKTTLPFLSFQPAVSCNPELSEAIILQVKQVDSTVEAGAQFQQMVNVECISDFNTLPDLNLTFTYNGAPQSVNINLPISINKFIEPTEMNGEAFFSRWRNLSIPSQECQKIFKASLPMELAETTAGTKAKLIGYGFQLLENIDPNPDNYVCAGIVHTRQLQIGCLLRLEPNKQANMYRLTVRTSKESTSQTICAVLGEQF